MSIAGILARAAMQQGWHVKQSEVHGMSQRGGEVSSHLRLSTLPIHADTIGTGTADIIMALDPMEALRHSHILTPGGCIVTTTVPFVNIDNYPAVEAIFEEMATRAATVAVDTDAIARQVASARSANMVLLGAALPRLGLPADAVLKAVADNFARKGPEIVNRNIAAVKAGMQQSLSTALNNK